MNEANVTVLYFARIAELTGTRSETLALPEPATGTQLLAQLRQRHPALQPLKALRLAVNHTHAPAGVSLSAGDEVAVFEPVTGG